MALQFTRLSDQHGPAVYLLGTSMLETKLTALSERIDQSTSKDTQVIYLDIRSKDGSAVADFYDIQPNNLPAVLIIMDDDTIHKSWFGQDLPSAEHIAHELRTITGSLHA